MLIPSALVSTPSSLSLSKVKVLDDRRSCSCLSQVLKPGTVNVVVRLTRFTDVYDIETMIIVSRRKWCEM